ncbi:MAG: amidase [Actinobacteria bacterium]|nr:amidase [Actinomycetota bacterium]MBO0785497.1 amidase [Actinomycetota bacterium]
MATFITRVPGSGGGLRLAVKDLIDVAGVPTTAGSRALADAAAAERDAPCLAGARAAGARIVGKANLNELAFGATGVNEYFGTPVNPIDPSRVPGGSSSGSAVAVAGGEADLAYGSDTGGSIRVPAAFCGVTGLKTTHGRIPLAGVWPLAPSMDTIGPMARDVAGVAAGMALLEPGFAVDVAAATRVGRIRPAGPDVDPVIDEAVDTALVRCGVEVIDVDLPGWRQARRTCDVIIDAEAVVSNLALLADPARRDLLSPRTRASLTGAQALTPAQLLRARAEQDQWRATMQAALREAGVLAVATVPFFPPRLEAAAKPGYLALTSPVNLAGFPALALPVPAGQPLPASLQLIGGPDAEALLLATGAMIEAAV